MDAIINAGITFLLIMGAGGVAVLFGKYVVGPLLNIDDDKEE